MNNDAAYQTPGSLKISREVIASIARFATLEVEGVVSIKSHTAGMRGLLNRVSYTKPIKVELVDDIVNVEISIIAKYGINIPETASAVQLNVKNAIQSMTGLAVSRVDVAVAGTASPEAVEESAE
ncbi:MAG: Asp23/Gls24 family envelope stress response protein [Oscillospiraceae bacterium]|nr:Asp23/Gls24 family envelope stress response protein [Oscillospiraceae bacterium]